MNLIWLVLQGIGSLNPKIKAFTRGRKKQHYSKNLKNVIWFHCASVGEFEQARPIIEKIKKTTPSEHILLSFFSPSGFNHLKDFKLADEVVYSPFDTPKAVKLFLDHYEPKAIILIKYEFWKNLIHYAKLRDIPMFSVSSIFRPEQRYFKWYGNFFRKDLLSISHFFVQNDESAALLNSIEIDHLSITGDTRFDRVIDIAENSVHSETIKDFCTVNGKCLIAGSTWSDDEELIYNAFLEFHSDWKLIIAPHEVNKSRIEEIKLRFSNFDPQSFSGSTPNSLKNTRVLIIDSIGLLNRIYRYADICYVGGAFGSGLHNILEAAVWGKPITHGPKYSKFQEAIDLIALGGSYSFSDKAKGSNRLVQLQLNSAEQNKMGEVNKEYIYRNMGASIKVVSHLKSNGIF